MPDIMLSPHLQIGEQILCVVHFDDLFVKGCFSSFQKGFSGRVSTILTERLENNTTLKEVKEKCKQQEFSAHKAGKCEIYEINICIIFKK